MPVKQITNWAVFGEIQTATTTFIARLTRFRLWAYYNCDTSTIRVRFEYDTTSYEELCAFEQ